MFGDEDLRAQEEAAQLKAIRLKTMNELLGLLDDMNEATDDILLNQLFGTLADRIKVSVRLVQRDH